MELIPEIQILDGRVVQLVRGRPESAHDVGDPLEIVRHWADEGATRVHMIDVSGAIAGEPVHLELAKRLSALVPVQLGGGLRTVRDVSRALHAGVQRVVIGTAAVESPELLAEISPEGLVVALDVHEGRVLVEGQRDEVDLEPGRFAAELAARGVFHILCTTVDRDGTALGPDLQALGRVATCGAAVIAHGGVASLEDLEAIGRLPAIEGVVVGKALHDGVFTLRQAMQAAYPLD